jgi:hypothetical protein
MNDTLIREIVHKLAGRIGQMGSIDLSNQFHQIETKLNKSEKSDLLKNELDSAIQQLRLLLSTLQKEMPVHNP